MINYIVNYLIKHHQPLIQDENQYREKIGLLLFHHGYSARINWQVWIRMGSSFIEGNLLEIKNISKNNTTKINSSKSNTFDTEVVKPSTEKDSIKSSNSQTSWSSIVKRSLRLKNPKINNEMESTTTSRIEIIKNQVQQFFLSSLFLDIKWLVSRVLILCCSSDMVNEK